jgi:hypothetical protein
MLLTDGFLGTELKILSRVRVSKNDGDESGPPGGLSIADHGTVGASAGASAAVAPAAAVPDGLAHATIGASGDGGASSAASGSSLALALKGGASAAAGRNSQNSTVALVVRHVSGKTFSIVVAPQETIGSAKDKLATQCGSPAASQKLIHAGAFLLDTKTIIGEMFGPNSLASNVRAPDDLTCLPVGHSTSRSIASNMAVRSALSVSALGFVRLDTPIRMGSSRSRLQRTTYNAWSDRRRDITPSIEPHAFLACCNSSPISVFVAAAAPSSGMPPSVGSRGAFSMIQGQPSNASAIESGNRPGPAAAAAAAAADPLFAVDAESAAAGSDFARSFES